MASARWRVVRGINPARWWEYSLSASVMIVLIAMLTGVKEATALVALFGANAAMILFGLVMEETNVERDRVDWKPFVYGCIVGAVPWIAIALQIGVAHGEGSAPPGIRRRDLRHPAGAVQLVRGQHVARVSPPGPVGRPPVYGARVPDPQPGREECARRQVYAGALAGAG